MQFCVYDSCVSHRRNIIKITVREYMNATVSTHQTRQPEKMEKTKRKTDHGKRSERSAKGRMALTLILKIKFFCALPQKTLPQKNQHILLRVCFVFVFIVCECLCIRIVSTSSPQSRFMLAVLLCTLVCAQTFCWIRACCWPLFSLFLSPSLALRAASVPAILFRSPAAALCAYAFLGQSLET